MGRPEIPESFYNYGLFLKRQRDYDRALYIYKRYEQLFGPSLEMRLAVAGLYEVQGRSIEACNKYKEVQNSGLVMDRKTERVVQKKIQTLCNQGEE